MACRLAGIRTELHGERPTLDYGDDLFRVRSALTPTAGSTVSASRLSMRQA